MTEYRVLMQAQAKEQLSHHELLVQRLAQLEQRQGNEEQQVVRRHSGVLRTGSFNI